MTLYGEVAAQVGTVEAAESVYEALLPYRDQVAFNNGCSVLGSVERVLGLLATSLRRLDTAVDHLSRSYDVHTRMRAPVWQARSLLWWADALRRRGDAEGALELERRCLPLASVHGFTAIARTLEQRWAR
jgi:hypothetical protein